MNVITKVLETAIDTDRFMRVDRYRDRTEVKIKDDGEDFTLTLREENLSRPMEDIIWEFREAFLNREDLKTALKGVEGWM